MIPNHFSIGRLHILWWPLPTIRGRLEFRRDRSRDGKQVMRNLIDDAIAWRFMQIRHNLRQRSAHHDYSSGRTLPDRLGPRFRQNLSLRWKSPNAGISWAGYPGILRDIRKGNLDAAIESAWHDAADAAYWYRREKDWGEPDPEPVEEDETYLL